MTPEFWRDKTVLVTGHTGFKGTWLSLWLQQLGAKVIGFALTPPSSPNLFELANTAEHMTSIIADVRDYEVLSETLHKHQPEIIFHMAAQALVRPSYENPIETYHTNVLGTVHALEAARKMGNTKAFINVTSDKCYENQEREAGYQEHEPMGGFDPYSSSKGCAELVTHAYQRSYFTTEQNTVLASTRAGNVIGGGDWAQDRLIPDIMNAIMAGDSITIRNPEAIRPWQHVLDCLHGYLILAERCYSDGHSYAGPWNFGPHEDDVKPVAWILDALIKQTGASSECLLEQNPQPHEARYLKLNCSKAHSSLGWHPKLAITDTIQWIADWYNAYQNKQDMKVFTLEQIKQFEALRTTP